MKFQVGDRVILTSRIYGDEIENPVWQGKCGEVVGTIKRIRRVKQAWVNKTLRHFVKWDNNTTNTYGANDLYFAPNFCRHSLEEIQNVPLKKIIEAE